MEYAHNISQPYQTSALIKNMLVGAGISLVVISLFVLPVKHPSPAWGQFWMIRPLIVVPLVGAAGGAVHYFLNWRFNPAGWLKWGVIVLSLIIYIIGLWVGIILGLAGTLWN